MKQLVTMDRCINDAIYDTMLGENGKVRKLKNLHSKC